MLHKKSLGQHFLRDPRILRKIAEAAELAPSDTVLEVGPGDGALTALLLRYAGRVVAVEKDVRLIPILCQKFQREIAAGKLKVICKDILSFNPSSEKLTAKSYKLVANLPYYITGNFLRKFLQETEHQPSSMALLLQKEVARRIVAQDGRESVLSLSVKCYGTPRYIDTVKAGSFSPPPKVDSAIIAIENISKFFFSNALEVQPLEISSRLNLEREKRFFELLKKGFAHPRKFLSSNLGVPPAALRALGIPEKSRSENLSLADWKTLYRLYRWVSSCIA